MSIAKNMVSCEIIVHEEKYLANKCICGEKNTSHLLGDLYERYTKFIDVLSVSFRSSSEFLDIQ